MLKNVLVPLDGSRLAEAVLDPVASLVAKAGGTLTLLHAVTPAEQFSMSAREYVQRERRHSAAYLARLAERLGEKGPGIRERVVSGEASKAIVAEARREEVGLIAMSSHGRSGIREWVFGSVAERVLRSTEVPVLIFRGPVKGRFRIGKVAVALDGSREAAAVLGPATELSAALGASMVLMHAGDKAPAGLQEAAAQVQARGLSLELALVKGEPGEAIPAAALRAGADVLAFTTAGRTRQDRVFFGSVAEAILKNARLPLLVQRRP
jgi:nucleotide-binding universal stress UspA family protein